MTTTVLLSEVISVNILYLSMHKDACYETECYRSFLFYFISNTGFDNQLTFAERCLYFFSAVVVDDSADDYVASLIDGMVDH